MTLTRSERAAAGVPPLNVPQRRRGVALEDAILDAAFAELSEVGYIAFSLENVAARARTGKASIYRRWPKKADLVLDAVIAGMPDLDECGLDFAFDDSITTADALRRVAQVIADVMSSPAGDAMRAIKLETAGDPDLAAAVDERFQAPRRAKMHALLQRGVERGEVRPGAATELVADVLPAVLSHHMIMLREPLTSDYVMSVVEQVLIPLITSG